MRNVDFDGDGVADTLIGGHEVPGSPEAQTTGSHTALTRSGRDGHVIWKSIVDPRETLVQPGQRKRYRLIAFPSPDGDFDGDGMPDVMAVSKRGGFQAAASRGRVATLPVELLSGRTGAHMWSAGALPVGSSERPRKH